MLFKKAKPSSFNFATADPPAKVCRFFLPRIAQFTVHLRWARCFSAAAGAGRDYLGARITTAAWSMSGLETSPWRGSSLKGKLAQSEAETSCMATQPAWHYSQNRTREHIGRTNCLPKSFTRSFTIET